MQSASNFFTSNSFVENGFIKFPLCHNGNFDLWSYPLSTTPSAIVTGGGYFANRWRINTANLPSGLSYTLSKANTFISSLSATTFSSFCTQIQNQAAVTTLNPTDVYLMMQKHTFYSIKEGVDSSLVFSGNVATNIPGTYAAFIYFKDNAGLCYLCQIPVSFLGTNSSEYFEVTFPVMPALANLTRDDVSVSAVFGLALASGGLQATGAFLPPVAESALTIGVPGQSNLFASASSTFKITNLNLRRLGNQSQVNKTPFWIEKILSTNYPDTL